jgi:hypothetical protein
VALKYGVFADMSLNTFLFVIALFGFGVYFVCAVVFTMKGKAAKEETRLSKGVALKRMVQLYSVVQAAFLGLVFMLMLTF